ncbi:cysteine hydrolase family protein [Phaeobacter sp. HF9A]|uniref:cysteine hydrolase family protein n=1 Tax=Phaeobacter sp. HF9A TaxID=2721561 RepID=UPI0014316944|nr:isochorismatase family cysteine hydrolase [Phaeobacter sp. HF9A]NIZ11965.1 cysteine hydrolase [Phaeobacter sp. HF9A]
MKSALIILDMQNELIHPQGKVGRNGFAETAAELNLVQKTAGVAQAFRDKNLPVIFVNVGFEKGYVDAISKQSRLAHLKETGALVIGEFGTEFPEELAPQEGDLVVTKRAVNPFHNTNLLNWLTANKVERIVLAGVYTHMVVDSTARHGDDSGLFVTVLEDCCASPDMELHRIECEKILPLFGTVTRSEDFLKTL